MAQFSDSKDGLNIIRKRRDADSSEDDDDSQTNDKKCRGKGK